MQQVTVIPNRTGPNPIHMKTKKNFEQANKQQLAKIKVYLVLNLSKTDFDKEF